MDSSKHKSHIDKIQELFKEYSKIGNLLKNPKGTYYEEWNHYLDWIENQKTLLEECLKKLTENYSHASIMPVLREIYENFWVIILTMNGTLYYKYFTAKKGHDIEKIYRKWVRDLETLHNKGEAKDVLNVERKGKRIRVTYRGIKVNFNGKPTRETIPFYYAIIEDFNPIEAYVGKQKKIIEKYLTPPHLFHRFVLPNMRLRKDYFEFQHGVIPHLLLNKLINKRQEQRVIIHYNFLSLWSHPNRIAFNQLSPRRFDKKEDIYLDRLILLYIGNMAKMFLESFLKFLERQKKEGKISSPDKNILSEIKQSITNFDDCTNYFWFIYNKPSNFYKMNYAMKKIWRQHMFPKTIKNINLNQISDSSIPYYNDPLNILKDIGYGWTNGLLGKYDPEIKWE